MYSVVIRTILIFVSTFLWLVYDKIHSLSRFLSSFLSMLFLYCSRLSAFIPMIVLELLDLRLSCFFLNLFLLIRGLTYIGNYAFQGLNLSVIPAGRVVRLSILNNYHRSKHHQPGIAHDACCNKLSGVLLLHIVDRHSRHTHVSLVTAIR